MPVTPSVLGKTEDEVDQEATEIQRKVEEWQETHGWHDSDVGIEVFDILADLQGKPSKITFEDHFYGNTVKEKKMVTSDKVVKTKDDKKVIC